MRRGNVLAGGAFTSALVSLAAFILVLLVLGSTIYVITSTAMMRDVETELLDDMELFRQIYNRGGQDELAQVIAQFETPAVAGTRAAGLFDRQGKHLAGNLDVLPDFSLWATREFNQLLPRPNGTYRIHAQEIAPGSGLHIALARNIDDLKDAQWRLLKALIAAGAIVAFASIAAGLFVSWRTFAKLETVSEVLGTVSRGDMSRRIPIGQSADQIDRIAHRINAHLDRLLALTDTTKNTINAIAHDLRAPLNRASIRVQQALNGIDDEKAQQYLADIESDLEGLVDVFEAIMRISRIETGVGGIETSAVSVAGLLIEMRETFEAVAEDAGQILAVKAVDRVPPAMLDGDARMLRQMLANLIENANRHCPPGTTISVSYAQSADDWIKLIVADNGPGIPAHMRTEVLKPFQRLDTSRSTPGYGLGLALVAAIAARHHANLVLEDNQPGLKITVVFPPPRN